MNAITRVLIVTALAVAAPLLAAVPAAGEPIPVPSYAQHRLDRVAAALAEDPLFVDPDMSAALDEPGRARVRAAMDATARATGTPVYVVVIPNKSGSESDGMDNVFLHWLHGKLGRDGLYLMVNSSAWFEDEAFNVPRRLWGLDDESTDRPADSERRFADLADRLVAWLGLVRNAPPASPRSPELYSSPDPWGAEHELRLVEPETRAPFLTGLLLAGPFAGATLYGLGLGAAAYRRRRRTPRPAAPARAAETHSGAPAEPSVTWLRRTGRKELDRLRDLLPEAAGNPGRTYAVSAYDVAQILYDEAGEDPDRALDLAGAIVLARLGRAALAGKTAHPAPPCFVNPLHGPSAQRRKMQPGGTRSRRRPVCSACAGRPLRALDERTLKGPGPDGPLPHYAVPGVWRDTGFGADGDPIPRIQEYLGVE
ncbi:hypothetical protein [Actinomadura bangladeshensis]|uniref:TPM domain-containing protein n=1 Tax=Actinomadura bangladeshensis TaxID=453573 RepID=A0A4R4NJ47_9ACTN|nr:hypothetical protein [Actinomadura bangladeshensis]TDC08634.1 hypothetical protein E1284_30615 [Actinomadura bangladeshensis]